MSYVIGREQDLQDFLKTQIETCLDRFPDDYPDYYVTTEYRINVSKIPSLPIITVRVDHTQSLDQVFGRTMTNTRKGRGAVYTFTLHLHEKKGTGTHVDDPVLTLGRRVKGWLEKITASTLRDHAVDNLGGVTSRLSDPRATNMQRVIMGGELVVSRLLFITTTTSTTSTTSTSTSTTSTSTSTSTTAPP